MPKFVTDKVIYVEPNMTEDYSSYNSANNGQVYKSIDLEDMCVVIGLEVEVKGRTQDTGEDKTLRLVWQSGVNGDSHISFLQGTKVKTANHGEVNLLTTSFTETYLKDIEENGTCEMFGIKSIDVSYDNMMVPEVTINFIDVRGVSLFAQEEMRHHLSKGDINGIADNDIDGSFFKAFFTFPYPKFTLYVKGFYGKMVSYELTCSDFRSAFDSTTGNFNVTARFIGYAFSFLNDVMVAGLLAAPYSEYIGKEYWEDNIDNGRFKIGSFEMPTLSEICKEYKNIQEDVAKTMENAPLGELAQSVGMPENVVETLSTTDENIQKVATMYDELMAKFKEVEEVLNGTDRHHGDATIWGEENGSPTNSVAFICDTIPDELKELLNDKELKTLNSAIDDNTKHSTRLQDWNGKYGNVEIIDFGDYDDMIDSNHKIKESLIKDAGLRNKIDKKADEDCIGYTERGSKRYKKYYDAWIDNEHWYDNSSQVIVYQDFGLNDAIHANQSANSNGEDVEKAREKLQTELLNVSFQKHFNFEPTVENITKILMAHVETFVYMIERCANNISALGTQRCFKNLKLNYDFFPDAGKNNPTRVTQDTVLAPFPKVVNKATSKDDPEVTRWQDEWIGAIPGASRDVFEEIKLVEGLLNGISEAQQVSGELTPDGLYSPPEEEKPGIKYPLTYFDLFLKEDDSVFGNDINFGDTNEVFARFCVRAFSVLATQRITNQQTSSYGRADAENFLEKYNNKNDLSRLSDIVKSLTGKQVFDFISSKDNLIDKSKSSNPWGYNESLVTVAYNNNYGTKYYKLSCGEYGERKNVFAIKNWDFKELSSFRGENGGLVKKDLSNCYITTTWVTKDNKTSDIIKSLETPVQYLKSRYELISESKYKEVGDGVFKDSNFEFSGFENSSLRFFNMDGEEKKISDAVEYDSDGKASIKYGESEGYGLSTKNLFINKTFLSKEVHDKAMALALALFKDNKNSFDILKVRNPRTIYLPKCAILADGAYLKKEGNKIKNIRKSIVDFYTDYFDEWSSSQEFKDLCDYFTLEFKTGLNVDDLISALNKIKNGANETKILNTIISFLTEDGSNKFQERYAIVKSVNYKSTAANAGFGGILGNTIIPGFGLLTGIVFGGTNGIEQDIILVSKPTKKLSELTERLMDVVAVCTTTKFNSSNEDFIRGTSGIASPYLTENDLIGYFDGIIDVLRGGINKSETGGTDETVSVEINTDPDDIKVGVYNYIKLLHDKWLANNNQKGFYTIERMFGNVDGNGPAFHFIDSFYSKIGQTMYLNLETIVDRLIESKTNAGYTLLSLLSQLYADNKFLFVCVQNFLDFSKSDNLDTMFKPIPYIEMGDYPTNMPNFIVLHPYESSSKLDVEGADYPDDGFYLDDDNEANWPECIRGKKGGSPMPAFGVCYGQQYQNYFTNIQVDMNSPMATEQSIRAKFLIAGASTDTGNQGTQTITAGQDLYTIYANNSYTCTVTMMGCAWVQPMMYFVLKNVPMFRGSYMIVKVNHQIQPGFMTTTFKGVRMARTATRAVTNPIFGGSLDSTTSSQYGRYESNYEPPSSFSDIGNDCPYSYNDPLQREVKVPTNADAQAYCYAVYKILTKTGTKSSKMYQNFEYPGLTDQQARGICANIVAESRFDPYVLTIDGNSKGQHSAGGGLCGFYTANGAEGCQLFRDYYGESRYQQEIANLNAKLEPIWKENPKPCSSKNTAKIREMGLSFPIPFEIQVDYICQKIKTTCSGIKNCRTASEAAYYWLDNFERPEKRANRWSENGKWVNTAIDAKQKIEIKEDDTNTEKTIDEVAEGLRKSAEYSLKSSKKYADVSVTMTNTGKYYTLKAGSRENTNALFDCLLNTYSDWFDKIAWDVGKQSINGDANSVTVEVVKKKPSSLVIEVTAVDVNGKKMAQITNKDELNESLRISLEKYFKSKNINTASAIKSVCRSITAPDSDVEEWFGISTDNRIVQPCDDCMGDPKPVGKIEGFSGEVTNPLMKAVLYDVNHIDSAKLGKNYKISMDGGHGCCTSGPTTWYNRAKQGLLSANSWWSPMKVNTSTFEATKAYLNSRGFVCVWAGTKEGAIALPQSSLCPGDVCTIHAYSKNGATSHAQMWTGHDWRSDFIQRGIWVYNGYNGRGNPSVAIWRHPEFQEPGANVVPVA